MKRLEQELEIAQSTAGQTAEQVQSYKGLLHDSEMKSWELRRLIEDNAVLEQRAEQLELDIR